MYFNYLNQRGGKMEQDEDEIPEIKDDSRAFLTRRAGEVGIYLDAIDAQAENPREFGLRHCFMMALRENLQQWLATVDLVRVKGILEHRGLFKGAVLEEIKKGMVLVVTFDDQEALDSLWKLHQKDKLSALFQELFVTKESMKHCQVTKLIMRAKMWEDEYTACTEELAARSRDRVPLFNFKNDIVLLKAIRQYQKALGDHTIQMRDMESAFDQNLEEFVLAVKAIYPEDTTVIKTLGEFNKSVTMAKGVTKTGFETIDLYLKTLSKMREIFTDLEVNICYRLSQIHGVCETGVQKKLKKSIKDMRSEVEEALRPDHNLQRVHFEGYESKVNKRDTKMFIGLISVIPLGLEKLIDIDICIDDFITSFPEKIG